MKITKLLLPFLMCFIATEGCNTKHKELDYSVTISLMNSETKEESKEVIPFTAKDDTTAYQDGASEYWSKKLVALETLKTFETPVAVPFFFEVKQISGRALYFGKAEAERLTRSLMDYVNNKALPAIDTITPLSKRPKAETPDVY